ncbi:hypothetical protein PsorP6_006788 [Peronosclerospora sorghi]|uniref:Uncharacterized protein n=1 Tax=Peronosclerospora sorghi TaxID=230839 RepID=A0ACC0W4C8_9STRA|nr:hypothetical protein PsorP6_006788 [Peronosclerospora sorghi]
MDVSAEELAQQKKEWVAQPLKANRGKLTFPKVALLLPANFRQRITQKCGRTTKNAVNNAKTAIVSDLIDCNHLFMPSRNPAVHQGNPNNSWKWSDQVYGPNASSGGE